MDGASETGFGFQLPRERRVTGGGHAWRGDIPGPSAFGYTTSDISAASAIWEFLYPYTR